jgi:hypothetical protein
LLMSFAELRGDVWYYCSGDDTVCASRSYDTHA